MPDDTSCLTPHFGATLVDATFPPAASFVSDAWRRILTLPFWCHNLPCRRIFVWRHILTRQFLTPHLEKNCFGAHILGGFKWVSPYWLHRYPAACRILYIALLLSRLVSFRRELGKTHVAISNGAFLPFWRRSCRASTLHYLKNLWVCLEVPVLPWIRFGSDDSALVLSTSKRYVEFRRHTVILKSLGHAFPYPWVNDFDEKHWKARLCQKKHKWHWIKTTVWFARICWWKELADLKKKA